MLMLNQKFYKIKESYTGDIAQQHNLWFLDKLWKQNSVNYYAVCFISPFCIL